MRDPTLDFQKTLDQIDRLLGEAKLAGLTGERRLALQERAATLRRRLAGIEGNFLMVGLLGGTGVGKSALMNALAGTDIASSSHRRPHTDRVLIYRHTAAPPPPQAELGQVPWHEETHSAEPLRNLLLCDLPDFDSLVGAHHRAVIDFLEHLDLLVWIASPEKYADNRFYDFLSGVAKARPYFTFVLNKVDTVLDGPAGAAGRESIDPLIRGFRAHIIQAGLQDPLIFAVSAVDARAAGGASFWNQFDLFRRHLLDQRHIKTIKAVKTANLEVELQQLLQPLADERRKLQTARSILADVRRDAGQRQADWRRLGQGALEAWIQNERAVRFTAAPADQGGLVGPAYGLGFLLQTVKGKGDKVGMPARTPFPPPPAEAAAILRQPFQWVQDHAHQAFLRAGLPPPLWEDVQARLDLEGHFQRLGLNLVEGCEDFAAAKAARPSFLWFRAEQYLAYGLLTCCLLAALVGRSAWADFMTSPGAAGVVVLLAAAVETLFSPRGLGALLSYALVNLFLSIRFYRRYNIRLAGLAANRRAQLTHALTERWAEHTAGIMEGLQHVEQALTERIEELAGLE